MGNCKSNPQEREFPITQQFNADWLPFVDGKTQSNFKRDVTGTVPFQDHNHATQWAEEMCEKIKVGLSRRSLTGSFKYKQPLLSESTGMIEFSIEVNRTQGSSGPAKRSFSYVLNYSVINPGIPA
eukprot:PhF_6_TR10702/c0_g1_i1/m.17263